MSSWRDDSDLVREDDEALAEDPDLDERWRGIFEGLVPAVLGDRGQRGLIGHALRLMIHNARKYVSRNPEKSRDTVIEAIRMVAAQLRIEPQEVYDARE